MDASTNLTSIQADVIEIWDPTTSSYRGIQELTLGLPPLLLTTLSSLPGPSAMTRTSSRPCLRALLPRSR